VTVQASVVDQAAPAVEALPRGQQNLRAARRESSSSRAPGM
jgi:hypothetical protein